ncbi:hypothetical protein GQ53DRAFT_888673 [Thozetella sp. PMI_491]|nr:hypothetical protein GQ53DRAFT_888673 [Thozetella sp. PMI_491]
MDGEHLSNTWSSAYLNDPDGALVPSQDPRRDSHKDIDLDVGWGQYSDLVVPTNAETFFYLKQDDNGSPCNRSVDVVTPNDACRILYSHHHLQGSAQVTPMHTAHDVASEEVVGNESDPSSYSDRRTRVNREIERLSRKRMAVAKFRAQSIMSLQQVRDLEYEAGVLNRELKEEYDILRGEVHHLKAALREHVGCDCILIQRYMSVTTNRQAPDLRIDSSHEGHLV